MKIERSRIPTYPETKTFRDVIKVCYRIQYLYNIVEYMFPIDMRCILAHNRTIDLLLKLHWTGIIITILFSYASE